MTSNLPSQQPSNASGPSHRKRNAVTGRAAILDAAREAFTRAGYDGAGLREIAKAAGVTAMMVNHYFGSKEQLFVEVLTDQMMSPKIVRQDVIQSKNYPKELAAALVTQTRTGAVPLDGFLILLKSAANPLAAEIGREQIERFHQRNMEQALTGAEAGERAALILSMVLGFQLMQQMFGLRALVHAETNDLIDRLAGVFDLLIGGK